MSAETVQNYQNTDTNDFVTVKSKKKRRTTETHTKVDVANGVDAEGKEQWTVTASKLAETVEGGEERRVPVPPHRCTFLKENWIRIFTPVVERLQLQIRFNPQTRNVELRSAPEVADSSNLQKGADFVKAFVTGFEFEDAFDLLRLKDLYMETFEVVDVKRLKGDHLARAIGRLAGKGGKTKLMIENATETKVVVANTTIHILGTYENIQLARRAVCNLILGYTQPKVLGELKARSNKICERW